MFLSIKVQVSAAYITIGLIMDIYIFSFWIFSQWALMKAIFLFIKKALFPSFILIKISSQFIFLSFVTDPRKLKVCILSKLLSDIYICILFILLLFVLTSKYFVFSWWILNPPSFVILFRAFNNSSLLFHFWPLSPHNLHTHLCHFRGYCSSRHHFLNYVVYSYIKENCWKGITLLYSFEDRNFQTKYFQGLSFLLTSMVIHISLILQAFLLLQYFIHLCPFYGVKGLLEIYK